ncbi:hypothetical protein [Porphyrobacter sp. LM 6]|uniref:hypothetical protein n=1 Tax=Porphyrobacter sp. LM 6 TaxID=1896196 RepID=UPI0008478E22|nr:hypothetical protein [Porphyrobacter sp. LM 6]
MGAILLALSFPIAGFILPPTYRHELIFAAALSSLTFGFMFGGLGIALALMLVGAPVARLAGVRMEGLSGTAIALTAAISCLAIPFVLLAEEPMEPTKGIPLLLASLFFALPAALTYRKHVLLERAFERA